MKIAQKLGLLVGALLAAVLITILVLTVQLRSTAKQYQDLIDGNLQQREVSRTMLVAFGQQVTDLQQILLQARDQKTYTQLKSEYDADTKQVDTLNARLLANVGKDDPRLKTMLEQFESTHKTIGFQYEAALDDFVGAASPTSRPSAPPSAASTSSRTTWSTPSPTTGPGPPTS